MEENILLKLSGISKRFPGVKALDNVDFDLRSGEVHALVGENGAGKSTLMNIIGGIIRQDSGTVELCGCPAKYTSANQANELGIATVFQELSVVQNLSVAENIFFGKQPANRIGWINKKELNKRANDMLKMFNVDIKPTIQLNRLSVAMQQMVEILKALSLKPKILVLDEPTSSLTVKETEQLFQIIGKLKQQNIGIIYISHHLEEIFRISDRVTVLRDGRHITTVDTCNITEKELVRSMVGREIKDLDAKCDIDYTDREPLLRVSNLYSGIVKDVSFEAYRGEVLGFSGLVGAGRTEVAHALFGLSAIKGGTVQVGGSRFCPSCPTDAIKSGLIYLTEDRKKEGLFLHMSILENIAAPNMDALSKCGVFSNKGAKELSEKYVRAINVATPSIKQKLGNLSGGNQQKVLLSMWLATQPQILIVDEPTRGVDIAAKAEIHQLLRTLAAQGACVIVISSDLPEILTVCDRIAVMQNGSIVKLLCAAEATEQIIIEAASGMLN